MRLVGWLRCIARLGPWQAFKLVVLAPRMDRTFLIRARGFEQPILIRGRTSDALMVEDVIVCRAYSGFAKGCPARILDGGANIGLATIYWKQQFPEATIVAVEPEAANFSVLQQNVGHLKQVSLIQGGLWSKPTKLSVKHSNAEKYAIRVVEDQKGAIQAHSIDSIMKEQGWDWIDVVKLDVEGSEVPILAENSDRWIDKIGTLIIEIHQEFAPDSARVLFKAFANQDFHFSWRGENLVLRRTVKPQSL